MLVERVVSLRSREESANIEYGGCQYGIECFAPVEHAAARQNRPNGEDRRRWCDRDMRSCDMAWHVFDIVSFPQLCVNTTRSPTGDSVAEELKSKLTSLGSPTPPNGKFRRAAAAHPIRDESHSGQVISSS